MAVKSGRNDEARDRSKAALLQAGADLLVEDAQREPFASLKLRRICERADLSTGAFYLHWKSVDEYYDALAEHLAGDEGAFDSDFAALQQVADGTADASTLTSVTRTADGDFQLLLDSAVQDAMELLSVTWGRNRYQGMMARGARELDRKTGQLYASILARRDREPRPPLDWDRIGVVLQALVEGLGLRHKIDPAVVPRPSGSEASLYATTVAVLLAVFTRPIGDHANLDESVQGLLSPGSDQQGIQCGR